MSTNLEPGNASEGSGLHKLTALAADGTGIGKSKQREYQLFLQVSCLNQVVASKSLQHFWSAAFIQTFSRGYALRISTKGVELAKFHECL